MKQYHDLLQHILKSGVQKEDRTGTGTMSVFGYQMRFDLQQGFPLLTTKKLHLKSIIHELLWFISGSTNIRPLQENGVRIWDEWADENGELGPVYGFNWRRYGAVPDVIPKQKPMLRQCVQATYLGVANGSGKSGHPLGKTWEGMIARCYDKNSSSYKNYGAKGVHVCNRWLEFKAFADDAVKLPGYNEETICRKVLDKDIIGKGFVYSPETCQWVTDEQNANAKSEWIYTVEKDGKHHSFTNASAFCKEHGVDGRNFSDLWTGAKNAKIRDGFSFVSKERRQQEFDQISILVDGLKNNPDSRRHIVSAWNVSDIPYMALPPCHLLFQCYVANDKLSLQIYQRSADVFLGVPFNIASYALLTMMLAQVCSLEPGELIWTGGDCHLYGNHIEQAKQQLTRQPFDLPTMYLNPYVEDIDGFTFADFSLANYECHPHIKAEVSV